MLRDNDFVKTSNTFNKKSSNLATYYGGTLLQFDRQYLFSCLHFDTSSLRLFKRLSPENKMWYFVVKQSMQFLEPGKYGLALSRILHSSDRSIFLLFWSNIKLDNSVAFCLIPYLKEFLCLYSLINHVLSFKQLYSRIYYTYHCSCGI